MAESGRRRISKEKFQFVFYNLTLSPAVNSRKTPIPWEKNYFSAFFGTFFLRQVSTIKYVDQTFSSLSKKEENRA